MRAAVPSAKLTGPSALRTTMVLPGSYVVTVPAEYVVVSVVVAASGAVVVVRSVVLVLVCANAIGAIIVKARAIIILFTIMPPLFVITSFSMVRSLGIQWPAT